MGYYEEFHKNLCPIVYFEDSFFIESTLRRIISLHQRKDIHRELLSSKLIVDILTELILLDTPKEYYEIHTPGYIKELKYKLNKEFKNRITLDELAREFNISKFHLAKEFKKHTGTTINEYLIDRRLNHSKELLKYSDHSISEIAFSCGMNQVSHYINLFKEREGKTPLSFRKEWRI